MQERERSEILAGMPEGMGEEELLGQGTVAAIREMRLRGKAKKAIARELGLDIKTVRKWSAEEWAPQRRAPRGWKLAEYDEVIDADLVGRTDMGSHLRSSTTTLQVYAL